MITFLRDLLFSEKHSFDKRLFVLGGIAMVASLVATIIVSLVAGLGWQLPLLAFVIMIIATAAMIYAYKTDKLFIANLVNVLLIIYLIFPLGLLLAGGVFSGVPIWFALCIVYIAMEFDQKPFLILSAIALVIFFAVGYYSYIHPEMLPITATDEFRFRHIVLSVVGVAVVIALMVRYQRRVYTQESEIAHRQREEIKSLSDAQSRFFSSMSHEIRTPLNTIIGLNEMTLRDESISDDIAENSQGIQNASKMLLALINDVLDISKIESGRMELAPVQYETSRMLSDIVNLLWKRAKDKGLRFDVSVGESIPSMLFGDEMRLKQVIINILTNAIKYTNEGVVSLRMDGERVGTNEFLLRVDVDDTGIGIRKEAIPTLFDTFKRVDAERNRNVEGTGLGLAISKQLIDLMDGSITVDSIYTKGSHFHIEVTQNIVDDTPMNYSSFGEIARKAGTYEQSFEAPEAHVLVVDDNDMNRMVTRKLLRSTLVQTDVASSGMECLEKTLKNHYDVIFMDHEMPTMDGIETLHQLRSQHNGLCRNTPVIALTANAGSDMSQFYLNQGFQAYLAKPIHGSLLEATLLQYLPSELIERTAAPIDTETISVSTMRHKRSVAVTTDCLCDIPDSMLREHKITRMPFYINTDEGRFRDLDEIDADNLFAYLNDGKRNVSTSPATVQEYESFFADALANAETVIHISIASTLSEGYRIACEAADSFGNVRVIDSGQASSGLGLVALRAAELAEEGLSPDDIVSAIETYRNKVVFSVLIPDYNTPLLGSKMPLLIRSLNVGLNLQPVLRVKRGAMRLAGFHGGYVVGAAPKFIRSEMRQMRSADRSLLFVTHSGCSLQEQSEIMDEVKKRANFDEIVLQKASATISSNVGIHAFGFAYVKE